MNYPSQTDVSSEATTYNGWANYETWNVSLYINNEYSLYKMACAFVQERKHYQLEVSYKDFVALSQDELNLDDKTPDGVSFTHPALDHKELDEMLSELVD